MELMASYTYMSMVITRHSLSTLYFTPNFCQACYFDRDDVAYYGFSSFFKKNSEEEREHGEKFIKYQNKRGGKVVFQDIARPTTMEWGTPLEAMEAALELEKTVSNIPLYNNQQTFRCLLKPVCTADLAQGSSCSLSPISPLKSCFEVEQFLPGQSEPSRPPQGS